MKELSKELETIKIDKYDLVQQILYARHEGSISSNDLDNIISIYERNIEEDIRKKRYSSKVSITSSQNQILEKICQVKMG